jgi:hypothetical protein
MPTRKDGRKYIPFGPAAAKGTAFARKSVMLSVIICRTLKAMTKQQRAVFENEVIPLFKPWLSMVAASI